MAAEEERRKQKTKRKKNGTKVDKAHGTRHTRIVLRWPHTAVTAVASNDYQHYTFPILLGS